jgi:hypothetical protein
MQVHAQRRPVVVPPNLGLNPIQNTNSFVNPFAPSRSFLGPALLGSALQQRAILNNQGLWNASAALGYGSLLNSAAYDGYGSYGTQLMLNPYEGYLTGAASLTTANAQYQLTIQQARLVREQAVQEHYRTRRAMMEQAEWEMAHRPDPEKIRQAALERELDRARHDPPSTEIWSGRSLNSLLRTLIVRQGQGLRGPDVPLNEDTLKSVNLTAGNTRGNIGLLKGNGDPQWPKPLRGEAFKETREELNRHLKQAANTVQLNRAPNASTLNDLQADLKKLQNALDANTGALSEDQYVEARRHLRLLSNTIAALKDPNVSNYLNGAWTPRGKNVAELVQFMRDTGLWFAPATTGDEAAYTALHQALAAFDAGMPRPATLGRGGTESDNGEK